VDIWGRARRSLEAADAQAQASDDDLHVVLQTLEADVASAYFNLRSLDSQSQILSSTVELYRQQVALTETKYRAGIVGRTDVVQAQAQLYTTTTLEVDARRQRADQEHALAILCGRAPSELTVPAASLEDLVPPVVPAGLPAEMLRHRPDVAEAEQNLVAANALIGVATADYYPTVNLTGLADSRPPTCATSAGKIASGRSRRAPACRSSPGGKLDATLEQTKARYDELLAGLPQQRAHRLPRGRGRAHRSPSARRRGERAGAGGRRLAGVRAPLQDRVRTVASSAPSRSSTRSARSSPTASRRCRS
jgi:outer membrane protein TolC